MGNVFGISGAFNLLVGIVLCVGRSRLSGRIGAAATDRTENEVSRTEQGIGVVPIVVVVVTSTRRAVKNRAAIAGLADGAPVFALAVVDLSVSVQE